MFRVTWIWGNEYNCPCCRVERFLHEDFDTENQALQHAAELTALALSEEDYSDIHVFAGEPLALDTPTFDELVHIELKNMLREIDDNEQEDTIAEQEADRA